MTSSITVVDADDLETSHSGSCTADEARALVQQAASAAVQFEEAMREIFRRKAWEPLGYNNPQDLILGEFKDTLQNPRTGKPYGRAHIYRMARVALFLHEVASRVGVDAAELDVAEKALRAARANGVDDVDMLTQIEERVIAASQADPETVQNIVDDVIGAASGTPAPPPVTAPAEPSTPAPTAESPAPMAAAPSGSPSALPSPRDRVDESSPEDIDWTGGEDDSWVPAANPTANTGGAIGPTAKPVSAPAPTPAVPDPDPVPGISWEDAVQGADDFVNFTSTLRTVRELGDKLPELQEVESKLPEFLDAADDNELVAFSEALDDVELILKDLPAFLSAVRAIQEAANDRALEL